MAEKSRELRITDAFVAVADTLIDEYDMIDLLDTLVGTCAEILDVDAGGLLLVDADGELQVLASTSEQADFVEVMQLNAGQGPCVECFTTGVPVSIGDIAESSDQWPEFRDAALAQGFRAVHATPLRLRGRILGAMNLFSTQVGVLNDQDIAVAQALADVATIGILQERSIRESHIVTSQLHRALESRVLIEQAKGVLAALGDIDMEQAFRALRGYARNNRISLRAVALGVTDRSLLPEFSALVARDRTGGRVV